MTSLESRDFVASPADIEDITKKRISASTVADNSLGTYLKSLVATTRAELDATPRKRTGKPGEMTEDEIKIHLAALEAVHTRFYAAVLKAITETLSGRNIKSRAQQKATTERAYKSLLRSWIRSGHDIRTLVAARVTKTMLEKELPAARAPTRATFRRRALGLADRLIQLAAEASKSDKKGAADALENVMQLLAQEMTALTDGVTTKPDIAVREGKPFRRGAAIFWPVTPAANDGATH